MHDPVRAVKVEQVLAVGLGAPQDRAVQQGRARGEPALRAADPHGRAAVALLVQLCQAVQGVTFGHRYTTTHSTMDSTR